MRIIILLMFGIVTAQREITIPSLGKVEGKIVNFQEDDFIGVSTEIDAFLGIPYAENPPIRFSQATPKAPWSDVWNATYFRSPCAQLSNEVDTWDEDCLYLNVFVKYPRPTNAAVMVWIHGGGFSIGTGSSYGRYGVPLVAVGKDVIIVTLNYRLMVWSVFNTGDDVATGNYGLLDQQLALQWIQDNIGAFGGDSSKVTLFGESAGAASVDFHLLSEGSKELFSQAIMQSGTSLSPWAFRHNPEADRQEANALGAKVGCDFEDSTQLVDCLRMVDAVTLMNAFWQVYPRSYIRLDGIFLNDTPSNLYASGSFKKATILAGYNKDEGYIAVKDMFSEYQGDEVPTMSKSMYTEELPKVLYGNTDEILMRSIDQQYIDWTQADNVSADYLPAFTGAVGDQRFSCPTDHVIRAHVQSGDTVFNYFMTHAPSTSYFQSGLNGSGPGWLGATHTEDIQFVFGWPFISEWMADRRPLHDDEIDLSVKVMTMWTNFAKYSHPGKMNNSVEPEKEGDFYWPIYTIPELEYKELSLGLTNDRAIRADECAFWNYYVPDLVQLIENVPSGEEEWREDFEKWQNDMEEWRNVFDEYQQTVQC
ncbi:cholinesterase 1-like [Lytechinus variegatus]|uniref:cholinesterase 1-like n=1 Tax=Lytechinus variegatus TaxID=7654 RepID=UPI001BB22D7A|nr:cholinesterase 1-like [Lytechinus variegatus]